MVEINGEDNTYSSLISFKGRCSSQGIGDGRSYYGSGNGSGSGCGKNINYRDICSINVLHSQLDKEFIW